MAIPMIKSTYSMDLETARRISDLASRWGVSKSEVLRRAVRTAFSEPEAPPDALAALDELQDLLGLGRADAEAWAERTREERRQSSLGSESRR